jgi:hypothetical protein
VSRSLQASPSGIELAKRALVRENLTQKAIANELAIASWSTVNKFFTGKPVDRFIFIEICTALDLDWEAIVLPPQNASLTSPDPSLSALRPASSALLTAVQQNAIAAREALTPRILERIPRAIVQDKYLGAIIRGIDGEQSRLIPIVAPAGYGKSTILGDIYDQLTQSNKTWVGLILCSSVSVTPTYFSFLTATYAPPSSDRPLPPSPPSPGIYQTSAIDAAFGKSLCGSSQSIVEVVTQLIADHGKGVLLIDTLDLIVNRDFITVFNLILRQLLDTGLTIVLTCRDHEYNDCLEPTRERLPGISQRIDRHTVPNFTTAEIRAAAEAFFRKLEPDAPDRSKPFADKILSLSADNRSLKDIIQNPLLLALLCDLFAQDGNVPPDLTVSKLYQRYWEEKVAYSRVDQSHAALLAVEKEHLCLTIARRLFERSSDKLCESLYRDEFGVEFTEIIVEAYGELLSEGVLDLLPSHKIHFFHQTLLEYAIAYWLTRHSAQSQRQQILDWINQPNASHTRTHWLPILRQHLTIIDESEFEALMNQLNHQEVGIFGVIAYAAASRDRPDALRRLLPIALELGESYQRRLRQALSSAPRPLIESTWDILLLLLQQANHATAGNTAQLAGSLLAEWWQALSDRLPASLDAIAQRSPHSKHPDERAMLSGWLLQPCLPLIEHAPNPTILTSLRQNFSILGYRTCATVIQLHSLPSVAIETQVSFLTQLITNTTPHHDLVKETLSQWLSTLSPHLLTTPSSPLGNTWSDILHHPSDHTWGTVQAKAIGRWAAQDRSMFTQLLQDYGFAEPSRIQRSLLAVNESLVFGGVAHFTAAFTQLDLASLSPKNLHRFTALLNPKNLANFTPDHQEAIAQVLQPLVPTRLQELVLAFDVLADASPTARQILETGISSLSLEQQTELQIRRLRFQPLEQHPPITQLDKPAQRLLIQVYRQQAATEPAAGDRLIAIAQSPMKDIALAASVDLDQIYPALIPAQVFLFLQSIFPGVRANALNILIRCHASLAPTDLNQVAQTLFSESDQAVCRLLCNLVTQWIKQNQQLPPHVLSSLATIPTKLLSRKLFEGGTARALMDALKAIAQSQAPTVDVQVLGDLVQQILTSINLSQVRNSESEMIDLLCALNRLSASFLAEVVEQTCPILAQQGWERNISAVVRAIATIEGRQSSRLEQIRNRDWCTRAIEGMILEVRGM